MTQITSQMRNYYSSKLAILVYLLLLPMLGWGQQPGGIDSTFMSPEINHTFLRFPYESIKAICTQTDGKYLVGGQFVNYNGISCNSLIRLNRNGSIDSTFFLPTIRSPYTVINAIVIQQDGKILIGGYFQDFNGATLSNIARLNSNGTLDTTFNSGAGANNIVNTLALESNGRIYVGGKFDIFNQVTCNNIVRLNSNGSIDNSFTSNNGSLATFSSEIYKIKILNNNKLLIGFNERLYNNVHYMGIVRLNSNGLFDSSFNSGRIINGFRGKVYDITLDNNNKILIGGDFSYLSTLNHFGIARLDSNGIVENSFHAGLGTNQNGAVKRVEVLANNNIIIGGGFSTFNLISNPRLVILNGNGSIIESFLSQYIFNIAIQQGFIVDNINDLVVEPNGNILIGGSYIHQLYYEMHDHLFISRVIGPITCTTPSTPTISGNNTICAGSSTILTSSSVTGNIWSTGDTTQSIIVNTTGSYTVWRVSGDCTSAASSPTVVSTIICNQIFTGDGLFTNTDRWNGGSIPLSGTDITIRGNMTLTSSVSLRNVNIENGGIVVSSGLTLTVTGNLSNQGVISGGGNVRLAGANNQEFGGGTISNLVVDNSATVIQNTATQISGSLTLGINQVLDLNNLSLTLLSTATHTAQLAQVPATSNITNAPNFTVQRWLNRNVNRRGSLSNGNYYFLGPVVQGQTMNLWNSVSRYNNQTFSGFGVGNLYLYNPTSNNWYKPSSASTSLPVGAGVQVWFGSTTFFSVRNEWSATGTPQVGDYNLPITPNQGFQLLSNPYPSTIDWESPNWTKTNVSNAIYIYDWVNRRYKSYIDGLGANGGSRYLPTAQGFIVRAESNSPVITAREGIKVSNQVALQRTESQASSVIRLQTQRGSMTDEVVIAHRPNTQLAYEPQVDARKMINPATNIFVAGTVRQSIASMDLNAATVIPIELLSDSSGNVTLTTTEFSGLSGGPYYLVDEITTEVYPYTPQTSYQFYLNANEPYSLSLRLNNVNGISDFKATKFEIYPNPATNKVTVSTTGSGTLEILNTLGQVVITQPASATNDINISKLAKGVYTVRFNGVSKMLVVK